MFFFFQAEDGIRGTSVTGVQTCALPICGVDGAFDASRRLGGGRVIMPVGEPVQHHRRSEERRVGKEGRSRWAAFSAKTRVACLAAGGFLHGAAAYVRVVSRLILAYVEHM